MNVYIAAASAEIERADHWARRLRAAGIGCTSSWIENVRRVGAGNPVDAGADKRRGWSLGCLADVEGSDALWLLAPPADVVTFGAWVELGYAFSRDKLLVSSGLDARSIFGALGLEFTTDLDAYAFICAHAGVPGGDLEAG